MNPIATLIAEQVLRWRVAGQPLIIGLCGTQASGRSTACAEVFAHLRAGGLNAGLLGLDDRCLGHRERADYAEGARAAMTDDEISRFIAHYERLTRHICDTMPDYADLVIELGPEREIQAAHLRATSSGTASPLLLLPSPPAYQA